MIIEENKLAGVYFIYNDETKLIKIGCSKNIYKRLELLQKQIYHLGYKGHLKLLDVIENDNYYDIEKLAHEKFKNKKQINEWYKGITIDDIIEFKNHVNIYKNHNISINDNKPNKIFLEYKYVKNISNKTNSNINTFNGSDMFIYTVLKILTKNTENISFNHIKQYIKNSMSEKTLRLIINNLYNKNIISKRIGERNNKMYYKLNPIKADVKNTLQLNIDILYFCNNKIITLDEFGLYLCLKYLSKGNNYLRDITTIDIAKFYYKNKLTENQSNISKMINNLNDNNIININSVYNKENNNGFPKYEYKLNY